MKRVIIVEGNSEADAVMEFDEIDEARQHLRHIEPGTYSILSRIETGIEVRHPEVPKQMDVTEGAKFRTRRTASNTHD